MTSTVMKPHEELRRNSVIQREFRDGIAVYVKRCCRKGGEANLDQMRQQAMREVDALRRIMQSGLFSGRLGMTMLIAAHPEDAVVVTREVAGRPLQEYLLTSYRRAPHQECLRALMIAGRWLKTFQQLPLSEADHAVISEQSPDDIVNYCEIRLNKLQSLGYTGLNREDGRRLLRTVQDCIEHSPPGDREFVLCHGDYGAFNVLWDGRVLTGIDFTQMHTGVPLLDVTYFLHHLQMLPIYFPWKRWPVGLWQRAFLRGYGSSSPVQSPMFRALMIRHWLVRLQSYTRRPPRSLKDKLHLPWVIRQARSQLLQELQGDPTRTAEHFQ